LTSLLGLQHVVYASISTQSASLDSNLTVGIYRISEYYALCTLCKPGYADSVRHSKTTAAAIACTLCLKNQTPDTFTNNSSNLVQCQRILVHGIVST